MQHMAKRRKYRHGSKSHRMKQADADEWRAMYGRMKLWQAGSTGKDHVYHVQGPERAAYSPVVGRMQDSRR